MLRLTYGAQIFRYDSATRLWLCREDILLLFILSVLRRIEIAKGPRDTQMLKGRQADRNSTSRLGRPAVMVQQCLLGCSRARQMASFGRSRSDLTGNSVSKLQI